MYIMRKLPIRLQDPMCRNYNEKTGAAGQLLFLDSY